jgi:hypothetical protein
MTTLLTNEEKAGVINQHKKNLEYSKYNIELSVLEESATQSPDQTLLNTYNAQILDLNNKIQALDLELNSLTNE